MLHTALMTVAEAAAHPADASQLLGPGFWLRVLEISPAIAALLAVIFLMYKLLVAKDKTIAELVKAGQGDIERQSNMITLLEVLVNGNGRIGRKGGG